MKAEHIIENDYSYYAELFRGSPHMPVMPRELMFFAGANSGHVRVIDATIGCGGHSVLVLMKNPEAALLGIDRDEKALESTEKSLSFAPGRFTLVKSRFSEIEECIADIGWLSADIILMDLGISSMQLDDASRGFSYNLNGPLDMRMDLSCSESAAERILNNASARNLENIFRNFGEIKRARKLADEIVQRRVEKKWTTTNELAELCRKIPGLSRKNGPPSPTLCFQALRIAVNNEIEELEKALDSAIKILSANGRIIVISFHSLEDRIVKLKFRREASECVCPPELPICVCGHKKSIEILTKKAVTPAEDETKSNRRAASAKMRAARKIPTEKRINGLKY